MQLPPALPKKRSGTEIAAENLISQLRWHLTGLCALAPQLKCGAAHKPLRWHCKIGCGWILLREPPMFQHLYNLFFPLHQPPPTPHLNKTEYDSKMTSQWILATVAGVITVLTFGVPLLLAEYFPWRSLWAQRHGRPTVTTTSYKGRTALITGANGAFGSRAAKIFAHRGVDMLVLVDVKDCGGVKAEIEAELGERKQPVPTILVWQIDMMSFAGCVELGKRAHGLKNLDHALLTAGILSFNRRESPEGWETCASNYPILRTRNKRLMSTQQSKSTSSPPH